MPGTQPSTTQQKVQTYHTKPAQKQAHVKKGETCSLPEVRGGACLLHGTHPAHHAPGTARDQHAARHANKPLRHVECIVLDKTAGNSVQSSLPKFQCHKGIKSLSITGRNFVTLCIYKSKPRVILGVAIQESSIVA